MPLISFANALRLISGIAVAVIGKPGRVRVIHIDSITVKRSVGPEYVKQFCGRRRQRLRRNVFVEVIVRATTLVASRPRSCIF